MRAADEALKDIRLSLIADGVDLAVTEGENELVVQVIIDEDACNECLVSSDVVEDVVTSLLRRAGEGRRIKVLDPRSS